MDYKKILLDLKNKYEFDNKVFINILISLTSILDNYVYVADKDSLNVINNNNNLKRLCDKLISLSSEDVNVSNKYKNLFNKYYKNNNLYDCFVNILFYIVLENKQPIFKKDLEIVLDDELIEYLKIKLYEGVSYITQICELAKLGNVYANIEVGSLEFSGLINGEINYNKCFDYYLVAAKKNNPKACYMVAYLIINGKVKKYDIKFAWNYLEKAVKLESIAALNTMGLCYLNGNNPNNIIDDKKAIELFEKASSYGYSYAYNNLGKYYENNNSKKSIYYYKCSADLNNSWALNKVGEYYRINNDLKNAYYYYNQSSLCPISELCFYSFYNLAKYYYINGNKELEIEKNLNVAKDYFLIALKNNIDESNYELKKLGVILNDL